MKAGQSSFSSVMVFIAIGLGLLTIALNIGPHDHPAMMANLQSLSLWLVTLKVQAPILFVVAFFLAYTLCAALCIPLEIPFALLAGALFGFEGGVVISSFASVIGATLAFLGARHLLRSQVEKRFPTYYETVNKGVVRDGVFYLINLRLIPILPFPLVNVIMGLTTMKTWLFYVVSQATMIFATLAFVHAGTQLFTVHNYRDLLSPGLMGSFAGLAALPWAAKGVMALMRFARTRFLRPSVVQTRSTGGASVL